MQFEVQHLTVDGRPTLRVRGELDIATSPQFGDAVADALASGARSLVVDLSETTFLDSTGARQLARTARHTADVGVGLQVVCPAGNRPVRLVIDLLDLHLAVPIVERADRADGGSGSGSGSGS
ncbi:STAS domain-containing protein [Trujillonella endophytica]|uniref:Anti-anti-sigma factor n=1 Tax=Trujillonella endophytica TaxID=673521 RepID=A0A1H8VZ32_9ACTN|nr:STAS domain-containing protein [Trujillella endophytica]SEP20584.1 anti-anti-sigma factor [Trujillella endophytica]